MYADPTVTALQKLDVLEKLVTELVARQPPPPVRFCQVALQTSGLLLPVLCIDMGVVLCHIDAKATASQVPVVVHVLTVVASNS